jgi:dimethylhistidine N-methyltransferase
MKSLHAHDLRRSPPAILEHRAQFAAAVHAGLGKPCKTLPTAYLYDARGSALFDAICELPEYYPTRTELAIMREHTAEMADAIGEHATLVEYGSGSSTKTRLLLDAASLATYVPVDISREHLQATAERLRREYPGLTIVPVCADFTRPFEIPVSSTGPRVAYFPGSTIGNFEPAGATQLLRQMHALVGEDGSILVGADLRKPLEILVPAYDDAQGVTAAFNLNLLERINRELDGDLDTSRFRHHAWFDDEHSRIVLELVSTCMQIASIDGRRHHFAEGERVVTEYSHKYTRQSFAKLAAAADLAVAQVWTDAREWFSVQRLVPRRRPFG